MTYRSSDKAHTIYKLKDGTRVPSVSTIASGMDKPQLVKWANNLGLQGIDSNKYVDALANAGTLAHYLVECEFTGRNRDPEYMREFSPVDVDRAETSLVKFSEWRGKNTVTVIASELEMVSEEHRFGGRCDLVVDLNGVLTLVDLKTAKALYGASDDKWAQVAGYWLLCHENGIDVKQAAILRIGRDPAEGFEYAEMPNIEVQVKRFLLCRELYDCNSILKKAG
jgi:hypothetical protein